MISITAVTKKFGPITAVNNVSLTVEKGRFMALLGPNGAGKTTIVRMLLGLSFPDAGRVTIDGIAAHDPQARRRVGYLAEQNRIPPYLTAREYLLRHCGLLGMNGADAQRETSRVIGVAGMTGRERQKSATFSKGMAQRIGIAAALLGAPHLLILDEPVSGLDPLGIRDVRAMLEAMRQDSVTVLLNSHLLSEVEKTCDMVAIMHKGAITVQGPIGEVVKETETLEEVFIRQVEQGHA